MPRKFSTAVLETLLKTVEVEFKVPLLGFGEIKLPISQYAKEWWENEKSREDLLRAIEAAELKFIQHNRDNKAAQLLEEFSLKNEEEFQKVIAELINNLNEQSITSTMAEKLGKGFENIIDNKEIQIALNDYIPYLRDELSKISEFHEVIMYLLQKQIAETTSLNYEATKEIKNLLLEQQSRKLEAPTSFTPKIISSIDKLPEPSDFLPPGSRMPFYRNKIFTGREQDLITLAKFVFFKTTTTQNTIITQIAATSGMGGIGKTQLAIEFCYRYGLFFHGVHWINARNGSIDAEIVACGLEMGFSNFPKNTSEQVSMTIREWKKQPQRLIILDNLEDPNLLTSWLPKFNGLNLLVTTRRQQYPPDLGINIFNLEVLLRTDSLLLVKKLNPNSRFFKDAELDALAERLGDLPLALDLAGRYLFARKSLSIDQYLIQLDKQGSALNHSSLKNWTKNNSPTSHETSLVATFLLSWKQLGNNKTDKLAKKFFIAAGYLAPNSPIPEILFVLLALPVEKEKKVNFEKIKEYTDGAILQLQQLGLLTENLVIHPLLGEFARSLTTKTNILVDITRKLVSISIRAVETDIPAVFAPFRAHAEKLFIYAEKYGLLEAAQLVNCLGYYHNTVAEYSSALNAYNRALEIWEKNLGREHHLIAIVLNNLGYTYNEMGDYHSAKRMFELAKDIDEKLFGENHPDIGTRYNNLGNALSNLGEHKKAKSLLEKALELDEKQYGPEHRDVSRDANSLGMILRELGELKRAKELLEKALLIDEKILDDDHPDTVIHTNNMGSLLQQMGDFENAKSYYERSLSLAEKNFGKSHPIVARRLQNFASLYYQTGDLPLALDFVNRAKQMYEKYLASEHPTIKGITSLQKNIEEGLKNS